MANPGRLRIQNDSDYYITYTVPQEGWNCCDGDFQRGAVFESVDPHSTSDYYTYGRTEGHGCDGRQGQFQLLPSFPTYRAEPQQFDFDSNGTIQLTPGPTPNYASQLIHDGGTDYTWKVTPTK
jgi:hypothetical protein